MSHDVIHENVKRFPRETEVKGSYRGGGGGSGIERGEMRTSNEAET